MKEAEEPHMSWSGQDSTEYSMPSFVSKPPFSSSRWTQTPSTIMSSSARASHYPPTEVVIKDSPDSTWSSLHERGQQRPSNFPSPVLVSLGGSTLGSEGSRSPWQNSLGRSTSDSVGSSFSSFKLKPRNPVAALCTPSPAGPGLDGIRGRKRRANSISVPPSSMLSYGSPSTDMPFLQSTFNDETTQSDLSYTKDESDGFSPGTPLNTSLSPSRCELEVLTMKGLSLQSPVARRHPSHDAKSPHSFAGNQQSSTRSRNSSFSAYVGSPAGSVTRGNVSGSASTSSHYMARTPCSSARSSPRHVPLTVISNCQSGGSPDKTLISRPPLHVGASSLLYSLDVNELSDDDLASPERYLDSRTYVRTRGKLQNDYWDTPSSEFCFESPGQTIMTSSSPKTSIPKITLTPRTPGSIGSRKKGLPMFPSSSDEDLTSHQTTLDHDEISDAMDSLLYGFTRTRTTAPPPPEEENVQDKKIASLSFWHIGSSNSLALSADGSKDGIGSPSNPWSKNNGHIVMLRPAKSGNSLDQGRPEQSRKPAAFFLEDSHWPLPTAVRRPGQFPSSMPTSMQMDTPDGFPLMRSLGPNSNDLPNEILPLKSKVSFTTCRSGAMFEAEVRGIQLDEESNSLSDSDDDEEDFVLTIPATIERQSPFHSSPSSDPYDVNRRARQRRRQSFDQTPTIGLDGPHCLTPALASNTSLFGMDIVHEDSSSTAQSTTPFASLTFKLKASGSASALSRRDSDEALGASFSALHHRKSEHSLGSLGLCVDDTIHEMEGNTGRDLVTPPITTHGVSSPPPLATRPSVTGDAEGGHRSISNVFVVRADERSIASAIASMARQAEQSASEL